MLLRTPNPGWDYPAPLVASAGTCADAAVSSIPAGICWAELTILVHSRSPHTLTQAAV